MYYCEHAPQWKASHFAFDEEPFNFSAYGYNQSELVWMAYWASKRHKVVGMNMSDISAWNGKHRSTKSTSSASVGYLMDGTFWDRRQYRIVREPLEFLDEIEVVRKRKIKGAYFQIDEAGVSMSSSGWYEQWARAISSTVQMIGYLNPMIAVVAPLNEFVLSVLRRLLNNLYICSRYNNEFSVVKPYEVFYSSMFRNYMYPRPTLKFGGQKYVIRKLVMGKPPQFIIDGYEEIMNPQKDAKLSQIRQSLMTSTITEKEEVSFDEQVEFLVKNWGIFKSKTASDDNVILDTALIRYRLDKSGEMPDRKARALKNEAERRLSDIISEKKRQLEALGMEKDKKKADAAKNDSNGSTG